jgi:hypothetical protein
MAKQLFQAFNFRRDTLALIEHANAIIAAYQAQGYTLTLRQLYYQFVSRDLLANNQQNYNRLGETISNARLAGLIDWAAIEDRTRNLRSLAYWDSPASIMYSAAYSFRIDKWARQPNRIECWVEKDALIGVLERVCNRHEVPYFACRGYVSQSEMYGAAERIARYIENGQDVTILHLGDHDPSGIDMTRDMIDRFELFLSGMSYGASVNVVRLALNYDQVISYNPPPNPAKATDSRFEDYRRTYGNESWELDALEPAVITELIDVNILTLRDDDLWYEAQAEERTQKATLQAAARRWADVSAYLNNSEGA